MIAIKAELQEMRAEHAEAVKARKAAEVQIAKMVVVLEEDNGKAEQLNNLIATELDTVRLEKEQMKEDLAQLLRERDEMRRKAATMEGRVEQLLGEREDILKAKSAAENSLTNLEQSQAALLAERAAAERKLRDRAARIEREREAEATRANRMEADLRRALQEREVTLERMRTFDVRERELLGKVAATDEVRRALHNKIVQLSGNIRVFVRIRPLLGDEAGAVSSCSLVSSGRSSGIRRPQKRSVESPFAFPGFQDPGASSTSSGNLLLTDDPAKNVLVVTEPLKDRGGLNPRQKKRKFEFDGIFTPYHEQEDLWRETQPLVQSAIDGFNVCIFAYGQTGSGKTYTMFGDSSNPGLITRAVSNLFAAKSKIEAGKSFSDDSKVKISLELLEIYNENVRDLLAPNSGPGGKEINLKLNSNEAVGNVAVTANSEEEVDHILCLAQKRRCVKATQCNSESSRSHMVFTVHFTVTYGSNGLTRHGKLHICDLAGSERLSKSGSAVSLST